MDHWPLFFVYIHNRKTPEPLRFRGILRLDTMVSSDTSIINVVLFALRKERLFHEIRAAHLLSV